MKPRGGKRPNSGRKSIYEDKKQAITVTLSPVAFEKLDEIAKAFLSSRSETLETLLRNELWRSQNTSP